MNENGTDLLNAAPTEAESFLFAAKGMLDGALPLSRMETHPVLALTLLCGHACEAALKAALSKSGKTSEELRHSPYGHNITFLWRETEAVLIELPRPVPAWVDRLNRIYVKPFHLRYPLGIHGIVLPDISAMVSGSESLVLLAEKYVNA